MEQLSSRAEGTGLRTTWFGRGVFRFSSAALGLLLLLPHLGFAAHFVHPKRPWSVNYPDSWHIDQGALDAGAPLVVTSFRPGQRRHGGLLPPGGMEINVRDFPSSVDENAIIVSEPPSLVTHVTRSVEVIGGRGVLRADYDVVSLADNYHVTSVAVRVGERLFLIHLSYEHRPPDQKETAAGEEALSQVVSSLSTEGSK